MFLHHKHTLKHWILKLKISKWNPKEGFLLYLVFFNCYFIWITGGNLCVFCIFKICLGPMWYKNLERTKLQTIIITSMSPLYTMGVIFIYNSYILSFKNVSESSPRWGNQKWTKIATLWIILMVEDQTCKCKASPSISEFVKYRRVPDTRGGGAY